MAIDARCLNVERLRGMGKCVTELIRRTTERRTVDWLLLSDRPDLPFHVPPSTGIDASVFSVKGYRFHLWEQVALPRRASRFDVDVLHTPATTTTWWQPVPTVVTVHDAIPWLEGGDPFLPPGFYRDRLLPAAYSRAAAVVTDSDASRRDILSLWPRLQQKLHVIPMGVDERYFDAPASPPTAAARLGVTQPYLLYVGGSDARKRLDWALDVWQSVVARGVTLVVCGLESSAHGAVLERVPEAVRPSLVLAPFVSEQDMPNLYMNAIAVLYPSLYEGFGLPVVEAQATGTPVLFSDVSSLSELKGPSACVLPADNMKAWVDAIDTCLRIRGSVARPNESARKWARRFSWDAYVDATLKVYRMAM